MADREYDDHEEYDEADILAIEEDEDNDPDEDEDDFTMEDYLRICG